MKSLLIFVSIVGYVLAQGRFGQQKPQHQDQNVAILRQENNIDPDGSYHWSFEAENGIAAQEQGQLKQVGADEPAMEAQGSYQYVAPDGTPIAVQYVANENGFQPQGEHIPTAPPIPEAILRALDWIAAHPPADEYQKPQPQRNQYGR